jgi:hypothetical protein
MAVINRIANILRDLIFNVLSSLKLLFLQIFIPSKTQKLQELFYPALPPGIPPLMV